MNQSLMKTVRTQVLRVREGDVLVWTIGNVKENILPTQSDLDYFRKLIHKAMDYTPKTVKVSSLVLPDVFKVKVIRKDKKVKRQRK